MRIERVIGRNFQEASEITKQKYGAHCMVLSTSKVAGSTEMLVAVDEMPATMERQPTSAVSPPPVTDAAPAFRAAPQFSRPPAAAPSVDSYPANSEGARMVEAIRAELVALERRLAQIGEAGDTAALKLAVIGLGASTQYANLIMTDATGIQAVADRISNDINIGSVYDLDEARQMVIVGPSGAGKTTVAMQAASALVAGKQHCQASVASLRDSRVGSRERFFALADAAGHEASWGVAPAHVRVIDSGGLDLAAVTSGSAATQGKDVVVCLPAHINRSNAQRWLEGSMRPAGVILSHWESGMVPFGLLAMLAELQVPLLGVSSQAEPGGELLCVSADSLRRELEQVMHLSTVSISAQVA